ncbi:MAG: sigma-70 family RNA polymerase sigma factor, partial [Planctomycetes bacterium]|nr:sigma-70 family RNA polymerase sigma factor [Planctomycetota bacterium]
MNPPCRFSAAALQAQRPFLRVLALGLLLDEHHAEDAVQDTIVQTIEHGPRDESGLGPWMRTACRNLALNLRRGDSRRRQRERAAEAARAAAAKDGDEGEQLRAFVVDAVVALPEPYRDAILRRYYENQPPRTIARELGVPVTTVYSRLQKGLQRLRTGLEQRRVQAGIERDSMRRSLLLLAGWPTIAPPRPPAVGILAAALVATAAIAVLLWGRLAADPRIERQAVAATPTASGGNADASATVDPLPDPMPTADVERDRVAVAAAALRVTGRALDEARRP